MSKPTQADYHAGAAGSCSISTYLFLVAVVALGVMTFVTAIF